MRAHHGRAAVFPAHCGIGLHVCALRRTHAERHIYSITSMTCTNEAIRLAARLIIYSGDENATRPERSCSELDLIPLLDKVRLEIRELELFRLVELQPRILRAHLKFKTWSSEIKIGLPPEASASIWRAYYHSSSSLPRIRKMLTSSLPRVSIPSGAPSFCRSHQQLSQL
jgi:hypothetical protein